MRWEVKLVTNCRGIMLSHILIVLAAVASILSLAAASTVVKRDVLTDAEDAVNSFWTQYMFHVFSFRLRIEHYLFTQKSMDYFQFCRLEALWTSWRRGAIMWGTRSTMQATRSTDSAWWLVSLSSLLPNIFILRLSLLQKYHINQKSWVCVSIYRNFIFAMEFIQTCSFWFLSQADLLGQRLLSSDPALRQLPI